MPTNNTSRTGVSSPPVTKMPAYSAAQRRGIVLLAGITPVALAAAGSALMVSWIPALPSPIAIHWDSSGTPDGYGSVGGNAALVLVIVGVFGGLMSFAVSTAPATVLPTKTPKLLVSTSVWIGAFLTIGIVGSVALQRGLDDAAAAGSPITALIAGALVASALGAGAWFCVPSAALLNDTTSSSVGALDLATDERVRFSETLRPGRHSLSFLVLVPVVAVVVFATFAVASATSGTASVVQPWWPVAIGVAVLGAVAGCLLWRVRIDSRGLLVRSILGLPRFRLSLEEIASVRLVEVRPLAEFGGWGVRFAEGRIGIIVRAGSAVQVTRTNGKIFVFTTNDGETAAALLAGLLKRRAGVAGQ